MNLRRENRRIILLIIEPSSGTILIEGEDILEQYPIEVRRSIGYVIQETGLLAILKSKGSFTAPDGVYDFVSREYEERFGLKWLSPFGFNNTYAFAMRGEGLI